MYCEVWTDKGPGALLRVYTEDDRALCGARFADKEQATKAKWIVDYILHEIRIEE